MLFSEVSFLLGMVYHVIFPVDIDSLDNFVSLFSRTYKLADKLKWSIFCEMKILLELERLIS